MKNKPLIETNPHLKVPAKYRKALIASVASSTAVETGATIESIARILTEPDKPHRLRKRAALLDNLTKHMLHRSLPQTAPQASRTHRSDHRRS
jgi:hypothetical protein